MRIQKIIFARAFTYASTFPYFYALLCVSILQKITIQSWYSSVSNFSNGSGFLEASVFIDSYVFHRFGISLQFPTSLIITAKVLHVHGYLLFANSPCWWWYLLFQFTLTYDDPSVSLSWMKDSDLMTIVNILKALKCWMQFPIEQPIVEFVFQLR